VVALDDASFEVAPGEVVGLLGPNGAGKTTTLRLLTGLDRPTAGTALLCGKDPAVDPLTVRRELGFLSTTSGLPSRLTARESLMMFAGLRGLPDPKASVEEALDRFSVRAFEHRRTEALSTGMRQRLRIACAAVHRPKVLILDEPTAGLDVMASAELLDDVRAMRSGGAAVLFSTHVMREATLLCDRVIVLFRGRIHAVGTPRELVERTGAADLDDAFLQLVRG
jgi:sodium transport system ATP-binding protein